MVWSPLAVASLVEALEGAGKKDQAREVLQAFGPKGKTRRFSQLRIQMARKIMAKKK